MLYFSRRWMRPLSEGKRNSLVSRLLDGSQEKHPGHILCRTHSDPALSPKVIAQGLASPSHGAVIDQIPASGQNTRNRFLSFKRYRALYHVWYVNQTIWSPYSHVLMLAFPPAGIPVLLALTVSTQPESLLSCPHVGISSCRSSESMPLVINYIFILMTISVLTVVDSDSVIIVRLHHMEGREERAQRAGENFKPALPRIKVPQNAVSSLEKIVKALQEAKAKHCELSKTLCANEDGTKKKYDSILSASSLSRDEGNVKKGKKVQTNRISFIVFGLLWMVVTLGFMIPDLIST
ncbi:hypothetical protein PoB_002078600 [Plakobranchus ocellatus]|uniref:Uncharacterized protein n=1 Tax=Plakobranchus ocellatus TaxID=259542 RepID=A0AAV3Z4R5_9GAST|nr:hypothetical protein PoB_002078600 [Plakobranchus ocellatus]